MECGAQRGSPGAGRVGCGDSASRRKASEMMLEWGEAAL